jgi:hypothetical protein
MRNFFGHAAFVPGRGYASYRVESERCARAATGIDNTSNATQRSNQRDGTLDIRSLSLVS